VPLSCGEAGEAVEALSSLGLLGLSITAPLKLSLPAALGLSGPLNTLWRRAPGAPWQGANTDAEAFRQAVAPLPPGPVLLMGAGGVAHTSLEALRAAGRPVLQVSRLAPVAPGTVSALAPVGIVQATSLGMSPEDPMPFPDLLEAARPGARWAVEWIYKEDTAFALWARAAGLELVSGASLFEAQAEGQCRRFIEGCGGV
jgi:shikimate 5-dehydrogenase